VAHAATAEVRLYDHLFAAVNPDDDADGTDWKAKLNPSSLEVVADARVEPALAAAPPGSRFQFERTGYFTVDADAAAGRPVFNRTVTLRDTWAKIEKAG
jgi:glutaminyl-tRNA synthetase